MIFFLKFNKHSQLPVSLLFDNSQLLRKYPKASVGATAPSSPHDSIRLLAEHFNVMNYFY